MPDIEHAFYEIAAYHDQDKKNAKSRSSQNIIDSMIEGKTIYTFILRETLFAMKKNWEVRRIGKIAEKNEVVYKDVCEKYYEESVKILGECAQGKSFKLC